MWMMIVVLRVVLAKKKEETYSILKASLQGVRGASANGKRYWRLDGVGKILLVENLVTRSSSSGGHSRSLFLPHVCEETRIRGQK
jgi:hypothetical protein